MKLSSTYATGLACAAMLVSISADAHDLSSTTTDSSVAGGASPVTLVGLSTTDDLGLRGVESQERSDSPCLIRALRRNVNTGATSSTQSTRCGAKGATSSVMSVSFNNSDEYVTGIKVCRNSARDRVKGFRIRGAKLNSDGTLTPLGASQDIGVADVGSSEQGFSTITEPFDTRLNCDDRDGWSGFKSCPVGQIATGLRAHFNAGKEPRSLTGIALICRTPN